MGKERIWKKPSRFVVVSRRFCVPVLVTVTLASGITPPLGSVSVPTTLPVASCAQAVPLASSNAKSTNANTRFQAGFTAHPLTVWLLIPIHSGKGQRKTEKRNRFPEQTSDCRTRMTTTHHQYAQ